ncbi:N-acylneuraminate cytidylyltransferase [Microbacterium pumilum]|uniref:N-acylneuraminate cytidylyltransferase n=1 Tax=Microbacterium pumilum TaxID=344165 RepID=A0ABN2RSQ6_9MICO
MVAVIPARGGSKGVPRKNVRRVGGIPLVARAIAAAQSSASIDLVVVSTDDEQIAAIAKEWGADVVTRPAALAGDTASSESAVLHALEVLDGVGVDAGILVFLQPTSPFIDSRDLDAAIDLVTRGAHDCVFSAVESYGFLWAVDDVGTARGVNHDSSVRPRRQDREPHYLETGAFYVMDAHRFRSARHRFFGRVGLVEVAEHTAIEIDSEEQLAMAQAIAVQRDHSAESVDAAAVVTDFDGVHTDDTALLGADGRELVRVSRSDGMGIARLRDAGIPVLILSTETNPVVTARARKLRVDVRQGVDDKATALREWAADHAIALTRIAYVGNDINDLGCLELVGWPIAVPGSDPLVLAAARVTLSRPGGRGAVRELADLVLRSIRDPDPTTARHDIPSRTERHGS